MSSELTVTRALAELRTLGKRIEKLQTSTTFSSTRVTGKAWKDHVEETKSNYQSLHDLMNRYVRIKSAILKSNASTLVTIAGKTYTVAEAIAHKECITHSVQLLETLRRARSNIQAEVSQHEAAVQKKLDVLLENNFKKERQQAQESDIKIISESYLKNNKIEVVDPIGLDKEIKRLDEEISEFQKEVDLVLSESNAVTKIVV